MKQEDQQQQAAQELAALVLRWRLEYDLTYYSISGLLSLQKTRIESEVVRAEMRDREQRN